MSFLTPDQTQIPVVLGPSPLTERRSYHVGLFLLLFLPRRTQTTVVCVLWVLPADIDSDTGSYIRVFQTLGIKIDNMQISTSAAFAPLAALKEAMLDTHAVSN